MGDALTVTPRYVAHTPNASGRWQPLDEHLLRVADLARGFAQRFGGEELAYWAGLFHDLGKYSPEFQKYLRDCERAERERTEPPQPGSAPHKQTGAVLAQDRLHVSPLAFVILGHHGGMPNGAVTRGEVAKQNADALQALFATAAGDCPALANPPDLSAALRALAGKDPVQAELLTRMLFSCLVDADGLDTEAHTQPEAAERRQQPTPFLSDLLTRFREDQEGLLGSADGAPVNRIRREVYEACIEAAALPPGVFRLTVPTGGGKTRSSLAFALEHAVRHGLERVIYAIPYTSIIDQTVEVFEDILRPEAVLEHHSAIEPPEPGADEAELKHDIWRRLASQNWDAPLVVTTTVQLFESLFGNRPGRSRKVHRLARAVIVLDEVQALPPKLLQPIVDGLRTLADQYGSTVLLCTATQPALDRETLAQVGFAEAREIAPEPARLFSELRRVTFDVRSRDEEWSWERVAEEMRKQPACLAVLNTRKDAVAVLDALGDDHALHLSTLLCGRHRRDALAEIRRRLKAGEPCRVVSTQVVECGCDLDFPLVLRALGPLDRIVQAAGRCNREGRRPADASRVVVFRPADGGAPRGSYRVAIGVAGTLLNTGADLHDPAVYERYFRKAFSHDNTDAQDIQKLRERFDFPEVARRLRLIEEETVGVLVPYRPEEVEALLAEVRARGGRMTRHLWRRAQPHMVSLARHEFDGVRQLGLIVEVATDLYRWVGGYHPVRGLTAVRRDPADLIA